MTATNIVRLPRHQCILVMTDGAYYDKDSVLRGIATKIQTAPNWPGIITSRGFVVPAAIIATKLLARFPTFDSLIEGAVLSIREIADEHNFEAWGAQLPEIILAGWSAKRGAPETYVVNLTDELPPGSDLSAPGAVIPLQYTMQALPACVAGPMIQVDNPEAVSVGYRGIRNKSGSMDDCIDDMLTVIKLQRRLKFDGGQHSYVGGFVELTVIRPDAIEQRVLHRWPDKIGERVAA
jgi:hypothetical protein